MRRLVLWSVLLLVAVLTACGAGEDRDGDRRTDGPLRPQAGSGATLATPTQDGRTKTVTFGLLLCSDDQTQEIVLDAVRYDTVPATLPTDWSGDDGRPAIGTYLRSIPSPASAGRDILPVASAVGAPQTLDGDVVGLDDASSVSIDRPCDGYLDDDRTWPLVELLTVITADEGGAMATRTHIDYHVGEETYTTTVDWRLAICGTAMPRGARCRR
ncbi:hypothetical protein FE634_18165 [Nocardioides dongxiaopingii]|uniref:hypothetical protein n=1 Tax=Nocardioides sp. S-1144 TaxID=2582905 RepID=UPI00110D68AA|nr:hypothetical protein [Nocardioides sp. S-1144]QCW51854.1 hypothetical protein FE634_18165 [Nocardioides sp. S-1144]